MAAFPSNEMHSAPPPVSMQQQAFQNQGVGGPYPVYQQSAPPPVYMQQQAFQNQGVGGPYPVYHQSARQPFLGLGGPDAARPNVDPEPVAQWAFMWGWLLGFVGVPCAGCSSCIGYVINKVSPETFIKTRRDQESANFVAKAAKFGCFIGCASIALVIGFYAVMIAVAVATHDHASKNEGDLPPFVYLFQGGAVGLWVLFLCIACCSNLVPLLLGLKMHQNDSLVCTRQANGQMPSGPINVFHGAEMRGTGVV